MNIESIKNHIKEILNRMNIPFSKVEEENVNSSIIIKIETADSGILIGKDGEHLAALNHLIQKMISSQPNETELNLTIDVNDYNKQKITILTRKAEMLAARARSFKTDIDVEPMSSFERRIIHDALKGVQGVKTQSDGQGKTRHIVIKYIGELADNEQTII